MLPSVVTREIIDALSAQLRAQFPSTTIGFLKADYGSDNSRSIIDELIEDSGAIFKGPYVSFGLPFLSAANDYELPFESIDLPYDPYIHQQKAFERLTGPNPQPTLVATGTGSGKTECFMYPILEHCIRNPGARIKAIIIYPMNALANDQARRFAEEIHSRETLRGHIRVGLFTGDSETSRHKTMSENSVITCKTTQRENPPDVLLTNYKMLDFLLIRPRDRELWRFNKPDTLRYLVVDELHTFDGAQGTDLACLIRRLKDRLEIGTQLACVGTSATVGDETAALTQYASEVFDVTITAEAVLREERQSAADFLPEAESENWPDGESLQVIADGQFASSQEYVIAAQSLWFADPIDNLFSNDDEASNQAKNDLANILSRLVAFQDLLKAHTDVADITPLVDEWSARLRVSRPLAATALESLIALASTARSGTQPFVTVRVQLWLRELRRIVASVDSSPKLFFSDDLSTEAQKSTLRLPVLHCNQCHAMGWVSARRPASSELIRELRIIYDAFFNGSPDTCVLYPDSDDQPDRKILHSRVCSGCGVLNNRKAEECGSCEAPADQLVSVILPDMNRQGQQDGAQIHRFHRDCPYCESRESLLILGSRAATLSSVAINQIFNSTHNNDPKLIAFSDSVQDAAHRAGFFEARTFRQVIRSALATTTHHGPYTTLSELINNFGPYWRDWFDQDGQRDEDFVGTFMAPDLEWLRDWEQLQTDGALPNQSTLISQWLLPRLRWEVISEFGLRSRLGRTLERTQIAIAYVNPDALAEQIPDITAVLREQIAELADISERDTHQFVLGLLWRLRTRGGFYDTELDTYLQRGGDSYQLVRRQFLPPFGRQSATPTFLTLNRERRAFDHIAGTNPTTWYQNWFNKTLAKSEVLASASLAQAYLILLQRLSQSNGIVLEHELGNRDRNAAIVWSLNTDQWLMSTDIEVMVCDRCRNRVQVASVELEHWMDAPCVRSQCAGSMSPQLPESEPKVITPAERPPVRLITAEHTAVLDPIVRDHVERSFKNSPGETWDVNLLSATPTMEMGVDIGALSSVLLCSVPPAQANYLQRIGRAGRKDGNALNLTIANGVAHDLYFFSEPLEMMRGAIQPPGLYLGAIAVLERQMVAYCFDQWVKTGIDDDAVPAKLGQVLTNVERAEVDKFPQNFLNFVDAERGRISRDFINLFPGLSSHGIDQLQQFLYGEYDGRPGITFRVSHLLQERLKLRALLRSDINHLKREIDRLMMLPKDEATEATIKDTQAERGGLMRLVRKMNDQYTFNFFTDEGLLPNYAFPEDGVKLSSVIYRRRQLEQGDGDDASPFERIEFEIRRPAQTALRELAPFSRFYGNSRHVEIDQIEIRSSVPEEWRLCDRCNHAENLTVGDDHEACPRCGSLGWINASQKQTLLRLKEVYANASDRESRIGDDSDDREPIFFNRQFLFDVEEQAIENAHRIDDPAWPFGFEFVSSAMFREINFGKEVGGGPDIEVAGVTSVRTGFPVCMHCGKIRKFRPRQEDNHTRRCPMRDKDKDTQLENMYAALYLYRELRSEAVRVLLPFAEVAQSPTRLQSFIAALHLGLKRYFRGNVDHLQIMHYSEPVGISDLRRQYLVFMDTVPGGTGYLRDLLSDPKNFEQMLRAAYQVLADCSCQHEPDKDGCYLCLYAYRESYRLDETSRRSALETLSSVLERWESLERLPENESLSHTDINALFDSELERLFIEVIGNTRGCALATQHINGKPGYVLAVKDSSTGRITRWSIEPQVDLDTASGIAAASRPDFLIRCLSEGDEVRPMAVFLDGFEHHADIADQDTRKRFALLRSGRFNVWSLGWKDLPKVDFKPDPLLEEWFEQPCSNSAASLFDEIATRLERPTFAQHREITGTSSFQLFVDYLGAPVDRSRGLAWYAQSRVFGLIDQQASHQPDETLQSVGTWVPIPWQENHFEQSVLVGSRDLSDGAVTAVASMPTDSIADGSFETETALCLMLDDRETDTPHYKKAWHRFWTTCNVMQFLPHFLPTSRSGIEKGVYAEIIEAQSSQEDGIDAATSAAWAEAYEFSPFQADLQVLEKREVPAPEIGIDIQDNSSKVVATLEWAWVVQKVGFGEVSNSEQEALQAMGWTVVSDVTSDALEQLVVALTQ